LIIWVVVTKDTEEIIILIDMTAMKEDMLIGLVAVTANVDQVLAVIIGAEEVWLFQDIEDHSNFTSIT
jgi:hypothetical protein